ncbi:MAG: prolyl oligopeptidase family serine peptidase [Propionibacteriaceae bacterium]|jgi:dienelactone hydrolase|nr:prolyl oligopeptidase family serine peptidase [Propionibacteriaceae bacterium]
METARYGTWTSPIAANDLIDASRGLSYQYGKWNDAAAYWAQADPNDGGRVTIWQQRDGQPLAELTSGHYVRSGVNEYGGGAWDIAGNVLVYSDWPSGDLRIIRDGEDNRLLQGLGNTLRYGGLSWCPEQNIVLGVCEDHRPTGEPVNSIFAARADSNHASTLAKGADFYAYPTLSRHGLLAWMEWDHPNMPWDSTRIMVASLDDLTHPVAVAANPGEAAVYPAWAPDGALIYLSDRSGFWNFHRWEAGVSTVLHDHPFDFCGPIWSLDPVPYSIVDQQRIACSWLVDGRARLGVLNFNPATPGDGRLAEFSCDAVTAQLCGHGPKAAAMLGYADRPLELVAVDWLAVDSPSTSDAPGHEAPISVLASDGTTEIQTGASTVDLRDGWVSTAEPMSWDSPDGLVQAWYYPPRNPGFQAPAGELPPVQVWSHGGPTACSGSDYRLSVQYWTSRGFGIIDVNYSGSTGYGRAYRDRLKGQWGIADARDCVDAARTLSERGLADPKRLSIRGGSAGGYTTLRALTTSDVFSAGISFYGIGDLEALATDTHKFESRYLDGLIAPYPEQRQVWLDRSPINHLDNLHSPMLILQGSDDQVVPPQQAYAMAAALEASGQKATLIVFEGEGHGFRKAETIITATQAVLTFLSELYQLDR